MTVKQSTIIRAYKVIDSFTGKKMSVSISHKLWTIKRALQPHWDFQAEKEREVMGKYEPQVDENGNLQFKSEEAQKACMQEFGKTCAELADLDVDLGDFKKVIIHLDDKIDLSMDDIDALQDFVEFVDE